MLTPKNTINFNEHTQSMDSETELNPKEEYDQITDMRKPLWDEATQISETADEKYDEYIQNLVSDAQLPCSDLDVIKYDVSKELQNSISNHKIRHPIKHFFYSKSKIEKICLNQMLNDAKESYAYAAYEGDKIEETASAVKIAVIKSKLEKLDQHMLGQKYVNEDIDFNQQRMIDEFIQKRVSTLNSEVDKICRHEAAANLSPEAVGNLKENLAFKKLGENPENPLEKAALEVFMGQSFGTDEKKFKSLCESAEKATIVNPCLSGISAGLAAGGAVGPIGMGIGAAAGAVLGICFGTINKNRLESNAISEKGIRSDLLHASVVKTIKNGKDKTNAEIENVIVKMADEVGVHVDRKRSFKSLSANVKGSTLKNDKRLSISMDSLYPSRNAERRYVRPQSNLDYTDRMMKKRNAEVRSSLK